jgi:hypothetical protein
MLRTKHISRQWQYGFEHIEVIATTSQLGGVATGGIGVLTRISQGIFARAGSSLFGELLGILRGRRAAGEALGLRWRVGAASAPHPGPLPEYRRIIHQLVRS